jgi:hypothetical protein
MPRRALSGSEDVSSAIGSALHIMARATSSYRWYASRYDSASAGIQKEACTEGDSDVGNISSGAYTVYKGVSLTGATTLAVRVASDGAGGNIELRLDSAIGTKLGTCTVPSTGGRQAWATQTCSLLAASGIHDVYLAYAGGNGFLFNLEWFALRRP